MKNRFQDLSTPTWEKSFEKSLVFSPNKLHLNPKYYKYFLNN